MSSTLTLIEKPKNRAERENNELYYRQKFFSKNQLRSLEERNRQAEIANNVISQRDKGGNNSLNGGCAFVPKKKHIIPVPVPIVPVPIVPAPVLAPVLAPLVLSECVPDAWDDEL
jgi:hypothetical protein